MKISTLVISAALNAVAQSWSHEWNSDYDFIWTGQDAQKIIDESCKVSHTTAFQMSKTKDPIFFSTNDQTHPISPKLVPLNGTGGEQVLYFIYLSPLTKFSLLFSQCFNQEIHSDMYLNEVGNRRYFIQRHAIIHVRFLPRSKLCHSRLRQPPHQY